jgi:hypothetical protein
MPFNFSDYKLEVKRMKDWQLYAAKEKYTRHVGSGTATAGLSTAAAIFFPPALILSGIGIAKNANAGGKLAIITDEMERRGLNSRLRVRDVAAGAGFGLTAHFVGHGFEHLADHAITHATEKAVSHGAHKCIEAAGEGVDEGCDYVVDKVADHVGEKWALANYSTPLMKMWCNNCFKVGHHYTLQTF